MNNALLRRFAVPLSAIFLVVFFTQGVFSFDCQDFGVYFGPDADRSNTLDKKFIRFINSAEKSISGAFYEFRLDSIVDAFIAAKERGCTVKLLTDNDNFDNRFVKKLKKAGISIKHDNDRSGLMHNKFCIVDDIKVWTGSYNLTDTGSFNNNNNAVWFKSRKLAEIYNIEFNEMFVDGLFGPTSPSTKNTQKATFASDGMKADIKVLFAPEDNPNDEIQKVLKASRKSIYFMQFAFTYDEFSNILISKKNKGQLISGIFDRFLYKSTGPFSEFYKLTNNDIPCIIANNKEGKFHHKVFIIDPETDYATVILGSANATSNADTTNDENVMIIKSRQITGLFFEEFKVRQGLYSQAAAEIVGFTGQVGSSISTLQLIFYANGANIRSLKVDFPSRWTPSFIKNMKIFRNTGDTTDHEEITATREGFILKEPGLAPTGDRSYIIFEFSDIESPTITGGYNFYISTSISEGSAFVPLKNQPGIELVEDDPQKLVRKLIQSQLDTLNALNLIKCRADYDDRLAILNQTIAKIAYFMVLGLTANSDYSNFDILLKELGALKKEDIEKISGSFGKLTVYLNNLSVNKQDVKAKEYLKKLNKALYLKE